jgi:hypothetical protein
MVFVDFIFRLVGSFFKSIPQQATVPTLADLAAFGQTWLRVRSRQWGLFSRYGIS